MRSLVWVALCILIIGNQAAHALEVDTTASVFQQLKAKLEKIEDYTADVKVNINVSFMKVPPLSGKLYYKAPDKMKLVRKGGISILPKKNMSFTLNTVFPEGGVTVIDVGEDVIDGKKMKVLKVIPDDDKSGIILTKVWIDEDRILALRTETTTRDGGTVKMNLEFGEYANLALPDKITVLLDVKEFKIPKGVTMDYDGGQNINTKKEKDQKSKKGEITINYLNYEINKGISDDIFTENE